MIGTVAIPQHYAVICKEELAVVAGEVEIRLAIVECGNGRVDTESLLDDGEGTRDLVEEVGFRRENRGGGREVGTKDIVVLSAHLEDGVRVLGKEVLGKDGGCGGGVVTCEDEELDLCHNKYYERRVDACHGGIFSEVGF